MTEIFAYLGEMLTYPFMQRAFLAGILISVCASLLGVSLVLKRYSMIGDGLSHVGFGALAAASALHLAPLAVAVPVVILAAFVLLRLSENGKLKGDAAVAMFSTGALAAGVMIVSVTTGMNADLNSYLFGSILAMSRSDVVLSVALAAAVLILYLVFYNQLFAVTFDPVFARATGVRTGFFNSPPRGSYGGDRSARHAHDGSAFDLQPHHFPGADRHARLPPLPNGDPCIGPAFRFRLRAWHDGFLPVRHSGRREHRGR